MTEIELFDYINPRRDLPQATCDVIHEIFEILQRNSAKSGWISVKDRLPTKSDGETGFFDLQTEQVPYVKVLAYFPPSEYGDCEEIEITRYALVAGRVPKFTYWQPLPQKPKEKE